MSTRVLRWQIQHWRLYAGTVAGGIFGYILLGVAFFQALAVIGFTAFAVFVALTVHAVAGAQRKAALTQRRPDYSLIARMEREVWGETFRHEGGRSVLVNEVRPKPGTCPRGHSTVTGDPCFTCEDEAHRRQFSRACDDDRDVLDGLAAGEICYTTPWMLDVDHDGQWWLHASGPACREPGGTVEMRVARRADGFHAWPPKDRQYEPRVVPERGRIPVRVHRHGR